MSTLGCADCAHLEEALLQARAECAQLRLEVKALRASGWQCAVVRAHPSAHKASAVIHQLSTRPPFAQTLRRTNGVAGRGAAHVPPTRTWHSVTPPPPPPPARAPRQPSWQAAVSCFRACSRMGPRETCSLVSIVAGVGGLAIIAALLDNKYHVSVPGWASMNTSLHSFHSEGTGTASSEIRSTSRSSPPAAAKLRHSFYPWARDWFCDFRGAQSHAPRTRGSARLPVRCGLPPRPRLHKVRIGGLYHAVCVSVHPAPVQFLDDTPGAHAQKRFPFKLWQA